MQAPSIDIRLHYRQGLALQTQATEVLYGGAAGGGKSHLLRAASILWAAAVPGIQIYLFRRLFPELVQNHMEGPTGYPVMLAPLMNSRHVAIVKNEIRFWNGAKIHLRHCQHEKSIYSYQGTEIHVLLLDELTHWSEKMYRFLRGRCRLGGLKVPPEMAGKFPRILGGTNPGGLGHHWVKRDFVDRGEMTIEKTSKEEGGMVRQFIPALLEDNPSLMENDPDYEMRLEGLGDPLLVRAMREGDWNVVAGSMYGYIWRTPAHVCEPFPIPLGWEIWRGGDDGFAAPSAIYWMTKDPDRKTIYVIAEFYKAGMLPDALAERTLEIDRSIPRRIVGGEIVNNPDRLGGLYDSAAFTDIGVGSIGQKVPTRGDQMNAMGARWKPVEKPPGSRVQRAQNLHRLLAPNPNDRDGKPGIIFFSNCRNAIRTIPVLQRDEDDPEDVDTNDEDHAYDAITYGVQWKDGRGKKLRMTGH